MTGAWRDPGAASLTLLSGAVMALAGVLGRTKGWSTAGVLTIPGGLLITAAFVVFRRGDGRPDRRPPRGATAVAVLISGAVMVFSGYAGSAWGWLLAGVPAVIGGAIILMAFALDRRG